MNGGAGNDVLEGESGDDYLEGLDGNDMLTGDMWYHNAGSDTLDGGAGNDSLSGGAGNDIYLFGPGDGQDTVYDDDATVGNTDIIRFKSGVAPGDVLLSRDVTSLSLRVGGSGDLIIINSYFASTTSRIEQVEFADGTVWHTPYLESARFLGTAGADNLIGSTGDDYLEAYAGNDSLSGDAGNDTLDGETGNDYLDAGDGNDTLDGGTGVDTLRGGAGNDTLDGGAGNDTLDGGVGDDIYLFASGDGQDTISDYDATVGNIDTVKFKSGIAPVDVVIGRDGGNLILSIGALGDKITVSEWFSDTAFRIEQVEFADGTVWDAAYLQAAARIRGTSGVDYLAGSTGDDYLEAYAGNDSLNGGAGNDTLDGGAGNDDLYGETGNDTYLFGPGDGQDTISDYDAAVGNIDTVQFKSGIAPGNITLAASGSDLFLSINGTTDTINLSNYFEASGLYRIEHISFVDGTIWDYSTVSSKLGSAINGTSEDDSLFGTVAADILNGFAGNDLLDGDVGADTLNGGIGDDTYYVDDAGDVVNENASEGADTVQSVIAYTLAANVENLTLAGSAVEGAGNSLDNKINGNGAANILAGGAGNDILDGGAGADNMSGGLGDDVYVIDIAGDVVTENNNEGTDTVRSTITYTLLAQVENLTLIGSAVISGTGNASNNVLTGNSAVNVLDGKGGSDTMAGGLGNDTYVVDDAGDSVVENANEGTDLVQSIVSHTLNANVENLTLTGSGDVNGAGNASNNILTGNSGNNILTGGAGNDTYVVTAGDTVAENAGEGTDTVKSAVTYSLSLTANVENLILTGSAAVNGTGNTLNNTLTGNTGVNILNGGDGDDTFTGGTGADNLTGGTGNDIFKYVALNEGGDIITDFSQAGANGADSIDVSAIDANSSASGNQAFAFGGTVATVRGVWFTEVGGNTVLEFDTNGNTGTIEMTLTLTGIGLGLSAADFAL